MTRLPDPQQPTATPAGQPLTDIDQQRIDRIANAFSAALADMDQPTAIRIEDPDVPSWQDGPRIGTTPPVTHQPGARRPAMSQRAVDLNTTLISTSVVIAVTGAAVSGVMLASAHANPTVIGWVCACIVAIPAALAIPVLALKSLAKTAKQVAEATPPEIHNHYNGHIDQRSTHLHTKTAGVIAYTRNQTPELPPAN